MAIELREALIKTDWEKIHAEGKTLFAVETTWFASEERCEVSYVYIYMAVSILL